MRKLYIKSCLLLLWLSSCVTPYEVKLEYANKKTKGLDLSSSNYVAFSDDVLKYPHLNRINLSNNPGLNWKSTAEKLAQINNLNTLFLNDNPGIDLKQVVIGLSKLKNLKHLYLTGNKLTVLPDEIVMLTSLESVDLSNNPDINIADVIEKVSKLKSLKFINVQKCGINELPQALINIKTLEAVNFFGNNLDSLPDLSQLPKIQSVDIGGNKFKSIPVSVTKIKTRINFYAQSNQITTIPYEIALIKFGTFNLTNNPLPPEEMEKVKKLVNARYKFY